MSEEPDLRFLQANERTLLAWVRSGLTLMAFGYAVAPAEASRTRDGSMGLWLGVAIQPSSAGRSQSPH
ncbi:MAG: YidH family protein [Kofleriaceae bacterium]